MTSKRIRHISLRDNSIREWVQDGVIEILHVPGKVNPADLVRKEMKDGAHFRRIHDSFMSTLSPFVSPLPHQSPSMSIHQVAELDRSSLLAFLTTTAEIVNTTNVSHLSSGGKQLLWNHISQKRSKASKCFFWTFLEAINPVWLIFSGRLFLSLALDLGVSGIGLRLVRGNGYITRGSAPFSMRTFNNML